MTGQVLDFTGSAHQSAFALLPWFVNGTLDAGEQAQVEQHLHECAACRREHLWLEQLAEAGAATTIELDADRAFRRLVDRLDDTPPAVPAYAPPRVEAPGFIASLLRSRERVLRFAVAMQLGVIVALGWVLLAGVAPGYRTLGAKQGAAPDAGSLVVVFQPATTERDLRRVLESVGARIVDGPTAQGAYVLDVSGPPEARAVALERLRGNPAVRLAESLVPEAAR